MRREKTTIPSLGADSMGKGCILKSEFGIVCLGGWLFQEKTTWDSRGLSKRQVGHASFLTGVSKLNCR